MAACSWPRTPAVSILVTLLALLGCGAGDQPLEEADPGAVPAKPSFEQAFSIIQRECAPCHREGRTDPRYDTCQDVLLHVDELRSVVLDRNTMPPGAWPRLSSEEKLTLERWIDQGRVAPCNAR